MPKRRHGVEKFPEIEEKIRSGEYNVRAAAGRSKNTCSVTWTQMRYIFDEEDNEIANHFYCAKCHLIFNLIWRNSGQVLKRHVESQCPGEAAANNIPNYFVPEYQPAKKRKIVSADKMKVREAALGFVVRDMRPVSAVNGIGLTGLLAVMTMIGAKYGQLSEAAIESMRLVPSRHTVRISNILNFQ